MHFPNFFARFPINIFFTNFNYGLFIAIIIHWNKDLSMVNSDFDARIVDSRGDEPDPTLENNPDSDPISI